MRLAQLARKLAIRPTEIVEFLLQRNIQIDGDSNTRLEDDHVVLILQKFAPARAAEVAAELVIEKEEERTVNIEEEAIVEAPSQTEEEITGEPSSSENEVQSEKPEVIKAPKVELSGLKVLGKIELPESKKKEPQPSAEETVDDQPTETELPAEPTPRYQEKRKQENRNPYQNKRSSSDRPKINPIALQREREALEAEKRRREQAEQEKEKRTQHYFKKVKVVAPTKSARLVKEEVEEMTPLAPLPKTWWGKFMKWLNT